MENLYEILQVNENASNEVIENAYKTLVKKYHPDISKDKKKAEDIMKKINNAHDILSDEKKKVEYDESLRVEREKYVQHDNASVQNEQQVSYNVNTNNVQYTENSNNEYDKNYDNYYDYINNYNIFSRIRYSSSRTKKVVAIILLIAILLIIRFVFFVKDIFVGNEKIGENSVSNPINVSKENDGDVSNKQIQKDENAYIKLNEFLRDIKQNSIVNINSYLTDQTKLTNYKLQSFENDINIYNIIIKSLNYEILDYSMINENEASVSIKLQRIDIESILTDYVFSKMISGKFNNIYEIQIDKSELINILKDSQEIKEYNDRFKLIKINNEWEIELTNNNIKTIFGTYLEEDEFILEY